MKMALSKQRRALTLERKVALFKEVQKGGRSKFSITKGFSIAPSTLPTVLKNRDRVIDGFERSFSNKWKRIQDSKFSHVEAALSKWLQNIRTANLPVTGPALMEKADPLALRMGYTDCHCSNEGLSALKSRTM